MEYAAEASYAPLVSIREGRFKFNRCALDPDQLFDLEADPHELENLAGKKQYDDVYSRLARQAAERWDLDRLDAEVRASQQRRLTAYEALRRGRYTPWDFQPHEDASDRYMRNHMDLNVVEERNRYPRGE